MVYEADGATWLRSTDFGDDKDRVLVKSDGEYTYLLPDIAYHRDKFARGFDLLIDVWGADHHGYVPRMKAALQALGHDPDEFEVVITQLVNLLKAASRCGCRSARGDIIELRDVLDEVGPDAARLTYLLQSVDSPQTFDFDLVKSQAMDNPVLLRADGLRPHCARSSESPRSAGSSAVRSPTSTSPCSPTSASSTCCARCSSCPTRCCWPPRSGPRTRSPPGCASWPGRSTASITTAT